MISCFPESDVCLPVSALKVKLFVGVREVRKIDLVAKLSNVNRVLLYS